MKVLLGVHNLVNSLDSQHQEIAMKHLTNCSVNLL